MAIASAKGTSTHEGSENPTTQGCGVRVVHPGGLVENEVNVIAIVTRSGNRVSKRYKYA